MLTSWYFTINADLKLGLLVAGGPPTVCVCTGVLLWQYQCTVNGLEYC